MIKDINFKGLHIAQCKGLTKTGEAPIIDFYKVTKEDKPLILKLRNQDVFGKYRKLADDAIDDALDCHQLDSFIAVSKGKPCGIITGITFGKEECHLFNFLTWSSDVAGKIKNAGEGLLTVFFDNAIKKQADKIQLDALSKSHSKCSEFYEQSGFKADLNQQYKSLNLIHMELTNTKEALNKKTKELNMTFFDHPENVDLNNLI